MKKKKEKIRKYIRLFIVFVVVLIFVFAVFVTLKNTVLKPSFLKNVSYDNYVSIKYYDIYGTHLNFKGEFENKDNLSNLKLILKDNDKEITIPWEINENNNKIEFTTSDYINEGINLESLTKGTYYLLVKGQAEDEDIYYPLENNTEYDNLEYYTLTKNGKNNKIDITWDNYEGNEILKFQIKNTSLPNDVYDITIDPGHDANDTGKLACSNGSPVTNSGLCKTGTLYKESDVNLALAKEIKNQLENQGYKVKLTRENEKDTLPTYGHMGSATTANDTKSKFNLAIHHNSSGISGGSSYLKGLELYIANDSSLDLAKLFVKNITEYANTQTSPKTQDKIEDGIYQRFFTEEEINEEENPPANKSTNTIYYYTIREVGGIATHAYNDGRYDNLDKNPYYNSNNTAESYLFEMGYLDDVQDLKNINNNKEGYAKGIVTALSEYLEN